MHQKIQLAIVIIFLLGLGVLATFVIWPYLPAIFLSGILALIFYPWHKKILNFIKSKNIAAFLTIILILIIFLLPIISLTTLAVKEAYYFYQSLVGGGARQIDVIAHWAQEKVAKIVGFRLEPIAISQYVKTIVGWLINKTSVFFSGAIDIVLTFLLSFFILFYLLKEGEKISLFIAHHSPLKENYTIQLMREIKESTVSVVQGSLIIALLQGIVSGAGFAIFGVPNPALWGGLAAIAALIPAIGTTLVTLPAIIYLLFADNFGAAVGMTIWAIIAVGLIDNIVGPRLISRRTNLHPLITFLSVVGGINFFGPLGFIAGPLVIILLFSVGKICFELISGSKNSPYPHN